MERERGALSLVRQGAEAVEPVDITRLYDRMHGGLLRYAMRMVDRSDAEDAVHDAVLKFMEQRQDEPSPVGEEEARPRLVAMLHDVLRDRRRTESRRRKLMQLISGSTAAMRRWSNPRRPAEDHEIRARIQEALQRVPERYRTVWLLVREDGLSPEEAADLLGITAGGARAALCKTNAELRQRLGRHGMTPAALRGRDDA